MYAIIIAFGGGVLFASCLILFIVLRRRRNLKKQDSGHIVVYTDEASPEPLILPSAPCGGAEAGSKAAACYGDFGDTQVVVLPPYSERDPCSFGLQGQVPSPSVESAPETSPSNGQMARQDAVPNIYEDGDAPKGVSAVAAGFGPQAEPAEHTYTDVRLPGEKKEENPPLSTSPRRFVRNNAGPVAPPRLTSLPSPPPECVRGPAPGPSSPSYLPMNGTNQMTGYLPMVSHGDLPSPPVVLGDGYEIPVPSPKDVLPTNPYKRDSVIYSEIPEYGNENIYATVDELR